MIVFVRPKSSTERWLNKSPQLFILPNQNSMLALLTSVHKLKPLGFTQEEWIAEPELWLKQIHPQDQAKVAAEVVNQSTDNDPLLSLNIACLQEMAGQNGF